MALSKKSTAEKVREAKLKILKLEEEYATQVYFETMPEYDPLYRYCFATSNMTIPFEQQDIDAWLRAVMKHMSMRREGHGGAYTDARLITIPNGLSEMAIDGWVNWIAGDLKKRAMRWKKKDA